VTGPQDPLRQLPHLAPSTSFRESFQYGNIFYAIMALLPPLYKQVSFSGFLKKRVFNEAGLSRTTFDMDEAKEWGLVDGYFKTTQHSKKLVASAAHIGNGEPQDFRSLRGACGLQSCAQDMVSAGRCSLLYATDAIYP
jgi:CubicO group peptidase (beta-lactamase class C family)